MPIKTGIAAYGLSGQVFHAPFISAHPGFELTAAVERHNKRIGTDYPGVCSVESFEEMLRMDEIELKVKKIIAEQLGIKEEDIKNESSFIEDLGADSLTTVEMSLALEDAFGIEIPDTEQENLRTVQQAIDFVKAAVNK